MPITLAHDDPRVTENIGRAALTLGPMVYCIEAVDFPGVDIFDVVMPKSAPLEFEFVEDLLGGVGIIKGEAAVRGETGRIKPVPFLAVPYFSWANRAPGAMRVWLKETKSSCE